jgi:hypothetical protein
MRFCLFIGLALIAVFGITVSGITVSSAAAAWRLTEIGTVTGLRHITVDALMGDVRVVTDKGDFKPLSKDGEITLRAVKPQTPEAPPTDIIPHATVTQGTANIAAAWLTTPTGRYGHGVLGDAIEAAAVAVRLNDGRVLRYALPQDAVYEDLTPRLYDMDGDCADKVMLVRSDLFGGAAVSILTVGAAGLDLFAEAYPIGLSHRWLNPVGAADFGGDGEMEVAAVVTPHLRGLLTFYKRVGRRLKPVAAQPGYSTHFIGSRVLGMSAILDVNDDGVADIVVPSLDRRTLRAVTLAQGVFKILEAAPHDSPIETAIVAADIDGRGGLDLLYGLADGSIILIRR